MSKDSSYKNLFHEPDEARWIELQGKGKKETSEEKIWRALHIEAPNATEMLEHLKYDLEHEPKIKGHTVIQSSQRNKRNLAAHVELLNINDAELPSIIRFSPERLALFHTVAYIETHLQRDPERTPEEQTKADNLMGLVEETFYGSLDGTGEDGPIMKAIKEQSGSKHSESEIADILKSKKPEEIAQTLTFDEIDIVAKEMSNEMFRWFRDKIVEKNSDGKYYIKGRSLKSGQANPIVTDTTVIKVMDCLHKIKEKFSPINANPTVYDFMKYEGTQFDLADYMEEVIQDIIVHEYKTLKVQNIVDEICQKIIENDKELNLMSIPKPSERHTCLVCGAPASGKGGAVAVMGLKAKKENGVDWLDVCKVNTDDHRDIVSKGLVLSDVNKQHHAKFNNIEAKMITDIANAKYKAMLKEGNAPHLLLDTVTPKKDKINLGLQNDGILHMACVTVPLETSLERMISRGDRCGRYVSSQYLLDCHRQVGKMFFDAITNKAYSGRNFDFMLVYNGGDKPENPFDLNILICGDMRDNPSLEFGPGDESRSLLIELTAKEHINNRAKEAKELYKQHAKGNERIAEDLSDKFPGKTNLPSKEKGRSSKR